MTRCPLAAAALLFSVAGFAAGCDALDAQQDFRESAFGLPAGIFRTDDGSNALNGEDDPDDWRSSPAYGPAADPSIVVTVRAYPNPARPEETVRLAVSVIGFGGVPGGLRLLAYPAAGTGRPVLLGERTGTLSDGSYGFEFFGGLLAPTGGGVLRRVVLLDGQGEPVTYGDVRIE